MYDDPMLTSGNSEAAAFVILMLMPLILLAFAGAYIFSSIAFMVFFKKIGVDAWKGWIPFYNVWLFLDHGKVRGPWSLTILASGIPYVGTLAGIAYTVFSALAAYNFQKAFNKQSNALWLLLFIFFTPVWLLILGLGKDEYDESKLPEKYTV